LFGAATAVSIGASTGTLTLANPTITATNATSLALNGASPAITTTSTTASVFNSTVTTLNIGGAATTVSIGAATGTATINNANVVITGNLTVNGTTTTVNSTTLTVDDINIELGSVASPTDITANGGGITLKGATDKTISWSSVGWTSSEDFNLVTGKTFEINGTSVLSATTLGSGVTGSSLTSVGTIGTGVWQGTVVGSTYGGTGVNNGSSTLTLAGNVTHAGSFTQSFTATANTSLTLPTTGTLATLAGSETFTNKTLTQPTIDNIKMGYTTTATAAGTTTLTVSSNYRQFFTGTTTQTVVLPVTSTLVAGIAWEIENNSTGLITVNSSGGSLVGTVPAGVCVHVVCIGTTLTTAADWDWDYISTTTITGTGANVLAVSPTLVTPALGTPSSGTLTSCTGLPISTGVSGLGTGVATFLATPSSANLASAMTDETGTAGSLVFSASPTFTGTLTAATVSATTLTETSDERLKTNITPLANALETIQALDGKAFIKDGKASVGLIAQQVQKVLPQVVVTGEDEMQTLSVQYGNIVAVLIEAVKEQQKQIEELKAKLGN